MLMSNILRLVRTPLNNWFCTKINSLFLFIALLFVCSQVSAQATLTISTPTSDGRFTVTWSGLHNFVRLNEGFMALGTTTIVWSQPQDKPRTGSMALQKTQPGTYIYNFTDCRVVSGSTTCSAGAGAAVTISVPQPTVTATFSPTTISENGTATLTWSSTSATNCAATGISGVSGPSGSVVYQAPTAMSANQTVTIPVSCFNGAATTTANASIAVQWVNDAPTLSTITNRTINEDNSTGSIAFTVNDEETAAGSLAVTATSSNTSVIPNNNLVLGGSGANRTITVTPTANTHGSATITVKVTDAHGKSAQRTFTVTVNSVNDAPTISNIPNVTIEESQATEATSFTVNDIDTPSAQWVVSVEGSSNTALVPLNSSHIQLGGSGTARAIKVIPLPNKHGSSTITVRMSDGLLSLTRSFVVTVNDLPVAFTSIPATSNNGVVAMSWSNAREFVRLRVRDDAGNWTTLVEQGGVSGSYTDTRTLNGSYLYQVLDCYHAGGTPSGNPTCTTADVRTVVVAFPAPTVTASISPTTINEGGTATLTWGSANSTSCSATGISGVSNTSGSVTYTAPSSMSSNQPVNISVTCGRGSTTATANATVNVNWVNDTPVISTIADRTINEDTSTGAIAFTVADEETSPVSLVVAATSSNTSLISNSNLVLGGSGVNRTLVVTPAANAHGSATITVNVTDAHGKSRHQTFTVTVNPINDAPTMSAIASVTIDENQNIGARSFTVDDVETSAGSLSVTTTSSNTALVPNNRIVLGGSGGSRTIKVTPLADKIGSATITVTVSDGQLSASRSFVVTVNDLPVAFTSIPTASHNGVVAMSWANAREFVRLRVRDDAGNWTTFIEQGSPSGSYTDTRTQNGNYLYQVLDCYHAGGPPDGNPTCSTADVRTVVVAFPAPVITASFNPAMINESPTSGNANTATLTWSATNAHTCSATGIAGVSGISGSVTYTAPSILSASQQINAVFTCTGQGPSTSSKTATLTVNAVNDPPTLSAIPEQFIQEDQSSPVLSFTVADEETAAASLVVTAATDNDALIPLANIQLGGSGATRTIRVTPKANAYGSANITVRVSDGQTTIPRSFRVNVASVNDRPTISPIPAQRIAMGTATPTLNFTVGDLETPAASLVVTASSDKTSLIAPGGIVLGGSGASRTLKITPVAGQSGLATVTVKVTDAHGGEHSLPVKISIPADINSPFDMSDVPADFDYTLSGGVTALGNGEFVAITQGSLSVSGGTASYNVPIELPPAIRDLAPNLSLGYTSHNSDGVMGVGWSLGGLSSIHRCRTTFATEGAEAQKSNPQYTHGDRLCLDGQKLVIADSTTSANDSTYWAANAEYQTEIDSFTRIQAQGSYQGGHQYFTLTTKDGRTLTFGRETDSQNSRIYAPGQSNGPIKVWALDKVEDRYGNSYQVHYLRDTEKGEYYPSHITWEPEAAVVFSYIDRTGNTPWGYDGGHKYERTKLLDKITTYIGVTNNSAPTTGTKVREYDIDYQLSVTTNRHLVDAIRDCGFTVTGTRQCAQPLQFEWQAGELGYETSVSPAYADSFYEDINNDGFADVIGEKKIVAWGSASGFVAANDSEDKFVRTIQTRFGKYTVRGVVRGDYVDVKIIHMSPASSVTHSTVVSVLKTKLPQVHTVDLNNDGLTDLYIGGHFWTQQDDASFVESTATVGLSYNAPATNFGIQPHFVDINNDGLLDQTSVTFHGLHEGRHNNVLYGYANEVDKFGGISSGMRVSSASPSVKTIGLGWAPDYLQYTSNIGFWHSWIDINSDGHADVLYADSHSLPQQWAVRLSTGDGLSFSQRPLIPASASIVPLGNTALGQYSFVMDYNKDGVHDFIVFYSGGPSERIPRVFYGSYMNGVLSFTNGGVDPFMGNLDYLIELEIAPREETINPFRGDINNDGIPDLIFGSAAYYAKQQQPDLLIKITDGFGAESELDYSPLVDDDNNGKPLYTPDSTPTTFPQAPVDRSMQVVKKLSVSNGIGGQVHTYFNYVGGKRDLQGRGFLGFAKIETTNTGSNVETATHYLQTFPYTGRVSEVLVKDSATGNLISHTQNHYTTHSSNGRFPYLDYSLQQDYQLLTSSQSNPLAVSKIDNSYDACGNLTSRTTVVGTGLSGTSVTGDLGTTTLTNTISNAGNEDCPDDFITETTVTSTEAGGINPRTVTSTFVPNAQFDVYQQTEFEDTALEVVTTTNRNEQGIIIDSGAVTADLDGTNTAARTTMFSDFEKTIYPATVTNAAGHIATLSYDERFGKVNQEADPNGLISGRVYDSLGRNVQETAADGTLTELLSWYCATAPVTCPTDAVYLTATRVTHPNEPGKLGAPLSITYYDSLQRVVRSQAYSLDQTVVKSDTEYTAEGYLHRVSEPFTGTASYWTTYSHYDALGRANTVTGPDGGSTSVGYSREGTLLNTTETVTVVTPNGNDTQITRRYTNALGQVTQVVDARNTPVDYIYDAQGNLKTTVVDNNALTTITVVHDLAGNKTRITDPDAGVISFAYNGFGELRRQTWQPGLTGHTKSITYTYDALGRQTGRTDQPVSGNATNYSWAWDAPGQLGLLASQSGNGITESFGYDHLSRVQTLTTSITGMTGSRIFTYGYDSFSRSTTTTTYPGGLSISRDYHASGLHVRTRDITGSTDKILWALGDVINERGQLTHELYGNGVVTAHTYAGNNGLLSGITSGRLTANNTVNDLHGDIQALSYEFDSLGNLHSRTTRRSDNNGLAFENTTESFAYDALNRVTASTTSGLFSRILDYQYDDLGNLTYRSDLGTLAYNRTSNAGVHAITSSGTSGTPGYKTYAYDKYGNMTSRSGETIIYDVFNKPLGITGSNGTTSFSYGPNHERFKQVSGGKTTYVINGGAYEEIVDTTTGSVTQKSYVDGFMMQTMTGSTTEITYLHKDHLGSTEAMSDVNGNLLNRMSFGVWGQRQQADWQSSIPATGELNVFRTTKGYTGHEYLDTHNLVHMGGRVYDPGIGRFLSADLYVQSPYNTQSFNRYSYVFNNPLSYNDPSGYSRSRASHPFHQDFAHELHQRVAEEMVVTGPSLESIMLQRWNDAITASNNQVMFSQQQMQAFVSELVGQGVTSFSYVENGQTVVANINAQVFNAATARNGVAENGVSEGGEVENAGLTLDDFAATNGGIDQLLGLTGMYLTYTAKQGQLAIIRENKWNGFNYQNGLRSGMRIINGASKGVFALGTSISLYQGMSAYRSGDGFGVAKSGVDITFSIGALVAGKVGMVGGITYYGTSTLLQYSPTATYYLVDKPVDFACKISGC